MKSYYFSHDSHPVPSLVIWASASWMVSLTALTVISVVLCMIYGPSNPDVNILRMLPVPIAYLVIVWGVYTGFGAVGLWIGMWIYWAKLEKSPFRVRAGWFTLLMLGMHYGALIYAIYVWRKGIFQAPAPHN
jgi:hypothetical protein